MSVYASATAYDTCHEHGSQVMSPMIHAASLMTQGWWHALGSADGRIPSLVTSLALARLRKRAACLSTLVWPPVGPPSAPRVGWRSVDADAFATLASVRTPFV